MLPFVQCTKPGKQIDVAESQDGASCWKGSAAGGRCQGELLVSANVLFSDLGADDMGIPSVKTSASYERLCTLPWVFKVK